MIDYDKYWQTVKAEAEHAKHMATLWKRCAKKLYDCEGIIRLLNVNDKLETRALYAESKAKKAEAELSALKKKVLEVASDLHDESSIAYARILAATEEEK